MGEGELKTSIYKYVYTFAQGRMEVFIYEYVHPPQTQIHVRGFVSTIISMQIPAFLLSAVVFNQVLQCRTNAV